MICIAANLTIAWALFRFYVEFNNHLLIINARNWHRKHNAIISCNISCNNYIIHSMSYILLRNIIILCFNIDKIGDHFTSICDNRTVQESITKSNFPVDFTYLEDVSLNASTLQLISSRVPTPISTRLSIKWNDFLLKEYIAVQFDDSARQRARTRQRVDARKIVKNFLSLTEDLRPRARRSAARHGVAWRASESEQQEYNQRRTFPRIRFPSTSTDPLPPPPLVSPRMKEHVKNKRENNARAFSRTPSERQDLESNSLDNLAWRFASRDQSIQLI